MPQHVLWKISLNDYDSGTKGVFKKQLPAIFLDSDVLPYEK